jgi:hypothetical protein
LICSDIKNLCGYLAKHETFEYRYMQDNALYELLDLDKIFAMLSELDNSVDSEVGASAARGQTPGGSWTFPEDCKEWRIS